MTKKHLFLLVALITCRVVSAQVDVDLGYDWDGSSETKASSGVTLASGVLSYTFNAGTENEVTIETVGGTSPSPDKKSVYKEGTSSNIGYFYLTTNQTPYIEGRVGEAKKITAIKLNGTSSDIGKESIAGILFSEAPSFDGSKITGSATLNLPKCRAGNSGTELVSIPEGTRSFRIYRTVTISKEGDYYKIDAAGDSIVGGNSGNVRLAYVKITFEDGVPPTQPTVFQTSGSAQQSVYQGFPIETLAFGYGGTANAFEIKWADEQSDMEDAPEGITVDLSTAKTAVIEGSIAIPGTYTYSVKSTDGTLFSEAVTGSIEVKSAVGKKLMAYVSDPSKTAEDAPFVDKLAEDFALTLVSSKSTGVDYSGYDIIVLSAYPNSGDAGLAELKAAAVTKPFLNMKTFQWQANRWNWITEQANSHQTSIVVPEEAKSHPLFDGLDTSSPIVVSSGSGINALVRIGSVVFADEQSGSIKVLGEFNGLSVTESYGEGPHVSYLEIPKGSTLQGMSAPTTDPIILLGLSEASWAYATDAAIQIAVNAAKYLTEDTTTSIENKQVSDSNKKVVDTVCFDLMGRRIAGNSAGGMIVRKLIYEDGSYVFEKVYIRE